MSLPNDKIYPWYLIDLHAFRYHVEHNLNKLRIEAFKNRDGRTGGIAVYLDSFPGEPAILVASDEPAPYPPMRHCLIPGCGEAVTPTRTGFLCDAHYASVSDDAINRYIADLLAGR
jgi:hypothetical protein